MITGAVLVEETSRGWLVTFELDGGEAISTGPYETRALAEERRDLMLEEALERVREHVPVLVLRAPDGRCVIRAGRCTVRVGK